MEIKQAITRYCMYQERCHSEVRNKLYELGCTSVDVEKHLADLIEANILNEERFARAYARGKFRMKQWGRVKIIQGLKLKKISEYCIKKALTEIDGDAYDAVLTRLAERKAYEIRSDRSKLSKKSKLYRYLVQKGFERDIVGEIVKALIG